MNNFDKNYVNGVQIPSKPISVGARCLPDDDPVFEDLHGGALRGKSYAEMHELVDDEIILGNFNQFHTVEEIEQYFSNAGYASKSVPISSRSPTMQLSVKEFEPVDLEHLLGMVKFKRISTIGGIIGILDETFPHSKYDDLCKTRRPMFYSRSIINPTLGARRIIKILSHDLNILGADSPYQSKTGLTSY